MRLFQDSEACEDTHAYTTKLTALPSGLYVDGVREDGDVPDDEWLPFRPDTCTVYVTRSGPSGYRSTKLTVSLRGQRALCRRTGELDGVRIVRHEAYGWSSQPAVFGGWWPTPLGEAPRQIQEFALACHKRAGARS